MFVAFIDESGNDGNSAVFAMACILLCDTASYYFGNDWSDLLRRFNVAEYDASALHRRRGDFSGWKDSRATEFQQRAVDLLIKWEVKHGGVVIVKDDFRRSFADTGFHKLLRPAVSKWKKPYLQAFSQITLDLREYADHQQKGHFIRAIFDNCQEFMGQAARDYADRNKDGKLGRMFVSNTREFIQLQAADFLAWEHRTHTERTLLTGDRSVNPIIERLLPHLFLARVWNYPFLEYLRKRVEAVIKGEDPESVALPLHEQEQPHVADQAG